MTINRIAILSIVIALSNISLFPVVQADSSEPGSAEELFERSGHAYRSLQSVEITFTTTVEIPNAEPGERVSRYILGKGSEAVIEIGSIMRVISDDDRIRAELSGHEDRYLDMEKEGDLASTLAAVRGRSSLAGLWEPVQAALRAGKELPGILDAFRYSRLLGELVVTDFNRLPGPMYEVLLKAENGSCRARFDGASFYLQEVEYLVEPPDTPDGYALQIKGRFETQEIRYDEALFGFEGGDRLAVKSLRDLSPAPPGIGKPPEAILSPQLLSEHLVQIEDLTTSLEDKDVLLVGEDHLYEEPPQYLVELLKRLDDRPITLLLEMPKDAQADIDQYLDDGSEGTLDTIFKGKLVLQLQHLMRWAQQNRKLVPDVKAIDEPLYEIGLKRAYLVDTRNPTMAGAISREWKAHPDRRIVVYAGQLHLMKEGRYRVNRPSRNTAGSRLPALGVPADKIAVIMLNGGKNFHLHSIWNEPGVLAVGKVPVRIPIAYFIDYPIFGIEFADEAFDYFVNLGPLTQIEVDVQ